MYTAERITSRALIEEFVFHPDCWERSKEDDSLEFLADALLIAEQCYFILVCFDGAAVGLMVCHEGLSKVVEIHIKVKPQDRKAHALGVGSAALEWLMNNTQYNKVITWVPDIYPEVRAFCIKKFGFTEEGCNRLSFLKGGVMRDMYLYGLTREEIEVRLCQ